MRENLRLGRAVFDKMAQLDSDFIVSSPTYAQLSNERIHSLEIVWFNW